jgi:hypothetical protein
MTNVMFSGLAAVVLTGLLALMAAQARKAKLAPAAAKPRRPLARRAVTMLVALAVPAIGAAIAYYSA